MIIVYVRCLEIGFSTGDDFIKLVWNQACCEEVGISVDETFSSLIWICEFSNRLLSLLWNTGIYPDSQ